MSDEDRYEIDRNTLISALRRLGWITQKGKLTEDELQQAVRDYQVFHGLRPDGWAGPVTERSLDAPRFCGLPDRIMEAEGQLCKGPAPDIKWTIHGGQNMGLLPHVPSNVQKDCYEAAWKAWADRCGIRPVYVSNHKTASVLMGSGPIDSQGNTLAWSELPCGSVTNRQLNQLYDTLEPWVISDTPAQHQIDLTRVAKHEIGHMLGLAHGPAGNLMAPTYSRTIKDPVGQWELSEVLRRYGPPFDQPPTDPGVPPIPIPPGTLPANRVEIHIGNVRQGVIEIKR